MRPATLWLPASVFSKSVIYACRQRKRNNITELDINKLSQSVFQQAAGTVGEKFMMNLQANFSTTRVHVSPLCPPRPLQFLGLISLFFVFLLQYHCKIEVVALFGPPSLLLCLASCVWVPGIPDRAGSFRCPFQRLNERKKQGRDEAS